MDNFPRKIQKYSKNVDFNYRLASPHLFHVFGFNDLHLNQINSHNLNRSCAVCTFRSTDLNAVCAGFNKLCISKLKFIAY